MLPSQAGYTSASVSAEPDQKISRKVEESIYVHTNTINQTKEFPTYHAGPFTRYVIKNDGENRYHRKRARSQHTEA